MALFVLAGMELSVEAEFINMGNSELSSMPSPMLTGKRVLCIVNSRFQLLSLLCALANSGIKSIEQCDLAIIDRFDDARSAAIRIQDENIFSNVYISQPGITLMQGFRFKGFHLGSYRLIESLTKSSAPEHRLYEMFPALQGREYDALLCSSVIDAALTAKEKLVPSGFTIFFDDGVGSHNGAVFKAFACPDDVINATSTKLSAQERVKQQAKRIIKKIRGKNYTFNIAELWLFNPGLREERIYGNLPIREIKLPTNISLLQKTLAPNVDIDLYKDKRFFFFSLPGNIDDSIKKAEVTLVEKLFTKIDDADIDIRLHPRRSADDYRLKGDLSENDVFWEMLVLNGIINDDSVLLGCMSTAQFTPKQLCGHEPHVVFLFDLLPRTGFSANSMYESVAALEELYNHKDRIHVPKSEKELFDIIEAM